MGLCFLSIEESTSYEKAAKNENWRNAMKSEILSIEKNRTWELTDLPKNHKAIDIKWIFKLKKNPNGEIMKHKARLVENGYAQQFGVDYSEVFAPVARLERVRLILAYVAIKN